MSKAKQLRQLLAQPQMLVLPGVYDCIGAKLAEQVGFEAIFSSGFGISGSRLGLPDYGLLTGTEMLDSIGKLAESVKIPLIADLDTGYGNPLNVMRTVTEAIKLGIGGCLLEDQLWPKKCGHFSGKRVISAAEQVEKIKAAVQARSESDLVIIARTDARATLGLSEALDRGRAYLAAGADIIFIEAPQSVEELKAIATAFPQTPLLANMIEGGRTPLLSHQELEELGFKIAVYPLSGLFAATRAIKNCFRYLKEKGTTEGFEQFMNFSEFEEIIEVSKYRQLEEQFSVNSPPTDH